MAMVQFQLQRFFVMEVKLNQRNRPHSSSLLPNLLPQPTLFSQTHSFHLITLANTKRSLKNQFRTISLIRDRYQLQEKLKSSLNKLWNYKNLFMLTPPRLLPVRTIGFIVLAPLIVFCVRCIIGASYARVSGRLQQRRVNKPEGKHHEFRTGHWRSALRDIREPDGLNSESTVDSVSPSEDEQISIEDLSLAYKKLDQDYEKFLSECGLSKWGYWRGGDSPES